MTRKPLLSRILSPAARTRNSGVSSLVLAGILISTGSLITGCANYSKRHYTVGSVPDDYRTRHPIVISEQEETMDVPVASGSYDLPLATKSSITGFANEFRKSASGTIRVMIPSGSSNEGAAQKVATKIVRMLKKNGIPRRRIVTAPYFAGQNGAAAPIRLAYASIKANVKGCGQWPDDLTNSSENRQYHNFGCASQNNLAAIIANPSDLLGPRGTTSTDAGRRGTVLDKYRQGEDTATVFQTTTTP
ncbi:MAG: CpaD family pilus assembly lipoprotein [Pseudomonadota bacterium]